MSTTNAPASAAPTPTYKEMTVPIAKLHPSKLNPRKHFDPKDQADLEVSIRSHGVITSLVVRPNQNGFEIAAGERRYRASKAVGLQVLPVRVRAMTDIEFLEIVTIENLQRKDIEPLEEAEGYAALLRAGGYDVDTLAAKVGKSASYVYQRLKLTELISDAKKLLTAGTITPGHAILLARLQPKDQEKCLEPTANLLFHYYATQVKSVRDFADAIKHSLYLDLTRAAFDKKREDLVADAGPCTTCPKRSGANPSLFDDIDAQNTCTDRQCFNKKMAAHMKELRAKQPDAIQVTTKWLSKPKKGVVSTHNSTEIQKAADKCDSTNKGVIIDGDRKGRVIKVCAAPDCKKHSKNRHGSSRTLTKKEREEQAKWDRQRKVERQVEVDLYAGLKAAKWKDPSIELWRHLANIFSDDLIPEMCDAYGFTGDDYGPKVDAFIKQAGKPALIGFALASSMNCGWGRSRDDDRKAIAAAAGLDLKKLKAAAKRTVAASEKKAQQEARKKKKTSKKKSVQTRAKSTKKTKRTKK